MRELLKALSMVLGLWLAAAPALHAQTPEQTAQARAAYAEGHSMFRAGDYEAAVAAFQQAYDAVPNPVVLISIAEAQQRLGRWPEAEKTLVKYLEERPDAPDRAQVEQQLESIRARPGILRVESTPPGAVIVVDGADTGTVTPAELSLEPGPHDITLHGVTGVEKQGAVSIDFGGEHLLEVDLTPPPEAEPSQPTEETGPVTDEEGERRVRRAAWASVGIGIGGAVMGGILGGFAIKQRNEFDDDPTAGSADKGEKLAIFADVGFGIAAAGLLTAVVLFTTHRGGDESEAGTAAAATAPRATVSPVFGRRGAGLATEVRF